MDTKIVQRIRESLERQRQNLFEWLSQTSPARKKIHLGNAGEQEVAKHLEVLNEALGKAENRTLGLCKVCNEYLEADRLEMDFTACVCLDHYSAEDRRKLEAELELAHKVQKSLLPQSPPEIPGLQVAAYSQPAEIVGGDYFDFFRLRHGNHGFAIADVMGKGMPASLLMASLQASLRILAPEHEAPQAIVQRLNALFSHNTQLIKFITLFLGSFDAATGVLEYCNAGHNPPLLVRKREDKFTAQWLKPTGAAIGLVESFSFGSERVVLEPEDVLLLYTDGLTEAMNAREQEFGEPRLLALVQRQHGSPPNALLHELRRALRDFTGTASLHDDFTMIAVKVA
jgi:sigma-B regulation protein RsbU (phosphoserine phosphatase)